MSTSSYFEDYIQRTEQLASTYLEGGQDDIINTLISLGYKFGEFYEACQVSDDLKKELGANVFLIFEVVNGEIYLVEIGIALDIALDSTSKLIDHPEACPDGSFKLSALEFKDRHPQVTWSQTEDEIFIDVNLNVFDDTLITSKLNLMWTLETVFSDFLLMLLQTFTMIWSLSCLMRLRVMK